MSNNLVKFNVGSNINFINSHTNPNPKNINTLLKTAKIKRINKTIQENKTKRQSIITKNRISKKLQKSPKKLQKIKKSKSNKNMLFDRIRTARNKEFNKTRKPLDYLKMICSDTGVCI
jgi:hypothetical protein